MIQLQKIWIFSVSSRCSLFWLATIELYLFIQNMLTPMGDHIIWKLRFESSGRNAGFSWKSRTRYLKRSSEKRCLSGLRHCSFRSSNRRNAVRASPKTAPDLPRIASLLIRGRVLFILQECWVSDYLFFLTNRAVSMTRRESHPADAVEASGLASASFTV